jgi:hypothetical protein
MPPLPPSASMACSGTAFYTPYAAPVLVYSVLHFSIVMHPHKSDIRAENRTQQLLKFLRGILHNELVIATTLSGRWKVFLENI